MPGIPFFLVFSTQRGGKNLQNVDPEMGPRDVKQSLKGKQNQNPK